jgi:hypothetical protein
MSVLRARRLRPCSSLWPSAGLLGLCTHTHTISSDGGGRRRRVSEDIYQVLGNLVPSSRFCEENSGKQEAPLEGCRPPNIAPPRTKRKRGTLTGRHLQRGSQPPLPLVDEIYPPGYSPAHGKVAPSPNNAICRKNQGVLGVRVIAPSSKASGQALAFPPEHHQLRRPPHLTLLHHVLGPSIECWRQPHMPPSQ